MALWVSSAERVTQEKADRESWGSRVQSWHVEFLNDYLGGIKPYDLCLLGARSGEGKTALATMIAEMSARSGKRVKYFALEADPNEIERRIKYRIAAKRFFDDRAAGKQVQGRISYRDWVLSRAPGWFAGYETLAEEDMRANLRTLETFYRGTDFTHEHLANMILGEKGSTDLFVVDHLHYIDTPRDARSENEAMKALVKSMRDTALESGVPVICVAHLRKSTGDDSRLLVPSLEQFHGSSDITKIATQVLTMSRGSVEKDAGTGRLLGMTYMKIAKDRTMGAPHVIARMSYDINAARYASGYEMGIESGREFKLLAPADVPDWARGSIN